MTSTGTVLSFLRPRHQVDRDWTQEELAQFYRVEAALIRSGLLIDVERGITDEGDPWFIFCRQDNGEVIAHFARIRDQYVIASSAFPGVVRGKDFALLISELMRSSPLPVPREIRQAQNIYLHPAAMLVALLATAFMVSSESDGHDHHAHSLGKDVLRLLSLGEFAILSAVAIATTWIEYQIDLGLKILEGQHTSEIAADTGHHPVSEVVAVLESFFKIGSDADVHRAPMGTSLLSLEAQHHTDTSIPAHALAGPTLTVQASTEKVSDLSITLLNSISTSDLHHWAGSSLTGPDTLTPIQSIVSESASTGASTANVFSQADHSPPLPQSSSQAAAVPTSPPPFGSASTDAYHALTADLTSNNLNVSIVPVGSSSLEASLQQALAHLQSSSGNQQVAQTGSIAAPPASAPPDVNASSSPSTSTFDAHADGMLQEFMSTN